MSLWAVFITTVKDGSSRHQDGVGKRMGAGEWSDSRPPLFPARHALADGFETAWADGEFRR